MKRFIFGSLSLLMLSTVAIPAAKAQTNQGPAGALTSPGASQRPGMAGETDQGVPGVSNQSTPRDPDMGESNQPGATTGRPMTPPQRTGENTPGQMTPGQMTPGQMMSTPNAGQRPGMAGETDQGVPGVSNQSTPRDPDMGESNQPGATTGSPMMPPQRTGENTPGQMTPGQMTPGRMMSTPDAGQRPGMPGETDQGVPGVSNQNTPRDPDRGESNQPGATPQVTPGQSNRPVPSGTAYQSTVSSQMQSFYQATPFDLVNLARGGYFQTQGIPNGANLATYYRAGRITAEDIVQVAADLGRVSRDRVGDQGFTNSVNVQLFGLLDHSN